MNTTMHIDEKLLDGVVKSLVRHDTTLPAQGIPTANRARKIGAAVLADGKHFDKLPGW